MIRAAALLLLMGSAGVLAEPSPRFRADAVWHQRVDSAPLHPDSAAMLAVLQGLGGWGNGDRFQIDFSLHVAHADVGAAQFPVIAHRAFDDYYLPDCEPLGTAMPVPPDAAFEGQTGLSCDNTDGDCHLLVVQGRKLFELYSGNLIAAELDALCLAVWDLDAVYPAQGRGEHCTSADAAGFPMAPLLPNADGVAAAVAQADGDLGHAIRFVLRNERIATDASLGGVDGRLYVRPASHAGGPTGPIDTVPYGVRMRLRADFPMAGYNDAAQVILRTMQRYGIVLSDGGEIALTFQSDLHTDTKWGALVIDENVFWDGSVGNRQPVQVGDFQIIDTGPRIGETWECVRSAVLPGDVLFRDGFEEG